jgi:hypothetical protein
VFHNGSLTFYREAELLSHQCTVNRRAAHAQNAGNGLRRLALFDQLPGVADLLRCELWLAPEFHTAGLGRLHAGTRAFADQAALSFGQNADPLP